MNRSFTMIQRSPLNRSTAKEAHLFPQSKRFNYPAPQVCARDSYDLHSTMMASRISVKRFNGSKEIRFKTQYSVSPSPDAYDKPSFISTNKLKNSGVKFGKDQKESNKKIKNMLPGPGSYKLHNPEKQLAYTMRARVNPTSQQLEVGPGQYNINSYQTLNKSHAVASKYTNSANCKIGKSNRFQSYQTISPAPNTYSQIYKKTSKNGIYSFGKQQKTGTYIPKTLNPGPGSYFQFSQFGELDKKNRYLSERQFTQNIFGRR